MFHEFRVRVSAALKDWSMKVRSNGRKKKKKSQLVLKVGCSAVHGGDGESGTSEKQRGCMEDVRVLLWVHVSKPDKSVS